MMGSIKVSVQLTLLSVLATLSVNPLVEWKGPTHTRLAYERTGELNGRPNFWWFQGETNHQAEGSLVDCCRVLPCEFGLGLVPCFPWRAFPTFAFNKNHG